MLSKMIVELYASCCVSNIHMYCVPPQWVFVMVNNFVLDIGKSGIRQYTFMVPHHVILIKLYDTYVAMA